MRKCQEEEKENETLFCSLLTIKNCQCQLCVYRVCVCVCVHICSSTDEWMEKMWYIETMEYYSAIKGMKLGHLQ